MKPNIFIQMLTLLLAGVLPFIVAGQGTSWFNSYNDATVAWSAVSSGAEDTMVLQSLSPPVLLPDGNEFKTWEKPHEYQRAFFVSQKQPNASDDNPGTEGQPWKTISRAAATLGPGERVIVKEGIYREWVCPEKGGLGPEKMITYQAAPGEKVVISGSEFLVGGWRPSKVEGYQRIKGVWMADLPDKLFDNYNPFREFNITDYMMSQKSALKQGWDKPPYTLPRGLVFQDSLRLVQVVNYEGLKSISGAYWVESEKLRIHVKPFPGEQFEKANFEITTRPFAFAPKDRGLGFICVDGFIIEHVANCFPWPQHGAISTKQGHHWIIENNIVREINAVGLDFGMTQSPGDSLATKQNLRV